MVFVNWPHNQIKRIFTRAGKDAHQQRISACLPEQGEQIHGKNVDHALFICRPFLRIPVYVFENFKQRKRDLVLPGYGLRDEVAREGPLVMVELLEKFLDIHGGLSE